MDRAKKLETEDFRVYATTNLKVLENRSYRNYTNQPRHCHMQFFRQVLSPLGLYHCLVYRNQPHGRTVGRHAHATKAAVEEGRPIVIHTPLVSLTKAQIIARGLELGVDYSQTTSCYDPAADGAACRQCEACLLRQRGFAEAGVEDPARCVR